MAGLLSSKPMLNPLGRSIDTGMASLTVYLGKKKNSTLKVRRIERALTLVHCCGSSRTVEPPLSRSRASPGSDSG